MKSNTSGTSSSTETGAGATSNTATLTVLGPPTIAKSFGAASIPLSGTTSVNFTITNPNASNSLSGIAFSDTLPAGLPVASTPNASNTCGGTLTANAGSGSISLSGGTVSGGGTFSISVDVTGTTAGTKSNTTGAIYLNRGSHRDHQQHGHTRSRSATFDGESVQSYVDHSERSLCVDTFTITNPAANTVAEAGVAFTDTLPAGLVVATPNGLSNTCGGTATATAGGGSISLTGGTVAVASSCTVSANVPSSTSGTYNNTSGAVSSTNGGTGNAPSSSLTVDSPPTVSKAFGASAIPLNGSTSLTLTITNPNSGFGLTGLAVTDNLPSGLVVAATPGLSNGCGGSVTGATSGSGSFSLSGGNLASGSCSISLNVTGTSAGTKSNTTGAVSSTETPLVRPLAFDLREPISAPFLLSLVTVCLRSFMVWRAVREDVFCANH